MASSIDRTTAFCEDVLAGRLIAGPLVRGAAQRHLNDLKHGAKRGLRFDVELANKAIQFFESVLCLNGGQFEGNPFLLLGWQAFVVGSLFGWLGDDGFRRFRVAYVETAKGSGKSPLAAGVGMKGLVNDKEPRAEIYSAATKKDQAMILFRDACAMYQHSSRLRAVLSPSGVGEKMWNLAFHKYGSFFRPISSEDNSQSGPRPHISLIDEVHEHKDNTIIEMLRAGTKSRRQAMIFAITNSGAHTKGPAWDYHQVAKGIVDGTMEDDSFFFFVCSLDEGDDPMQDESCWPKANPSLQEADLPGYKYIREQVREARNIPSKEALVRRLNFCQWTGASSPWLSYEVWKSAARKYTLDDLKGRRAIAALDLSSTTDLTALTFLVEPIEEGEPWKLIAFPFLPELGVLERARDDKVPYDVWKDEGILLTTPGRAISKLVVLQKLTSLSDTHFDVIEVAYDRWRIEDLISVADEQGIVLPPMTAFGQGYKDMSPAIEQFEEMLLNGRLVHNDHKVLNMCAGNAVIEQDGAENRKLSKEKATGRIDLIVAAVMCAGRVAAVEGDSTPTILQL